MGRDLNKDIVTSAGADGIEYNHLNLPQKITVKQNGSDKGMIEYTYDAAGIKLKKLSLSTGLQVSPFKPTTSFPTRSPATRQ